MRIPLRRLLPAAAVSLLALAVYANSFPGAFILDDVLIVRDNPLVRDLDVRGIFSTDYWGAHATSSMYRPLTILSYALNRALFGPAPLSFHLVNVLLHAAASLLLYLLLDRLPLRPGVAWLGAALFAVHPIHGEAVNTVVGRAELLTAAFTFLGLFTALGRGRRHRLMTAFWYALALLAKESAPAFVLILFCIDAFTAQDLRERGRERRRLYALLAAVTLAWIVLRTWALAQSDMPPVFPYATDNPGVGLPLVPRVLTAIWVQLLYVRNLLLPYPLLGVYTTNYIGQVGTVFSLRAAATLAAAALFVVLGVSGWRHRRDHALGMAFYLAAFFVNLNVVFLTYVAVADRLAYLPSAGFCLAFGAALLAPAGTGRPRAARLAWGAGIGYLALLAGLSLAWNPKFSSSSLRLWEHTVEADPRSGRGWLFLGGDLEKTGRVPEAEIAYRRSVAVEPGFPDSHLHLSRFLMRTGQLEEALWHADEVVRMRPGSVSPAQITAAQALLALGRPREALVRLDEVRSVYHSEISYLETRGKALDALGDANAAIECYRRIARDASVDAAVPLRLAELLIARTEYREAEDTLRSHLATDPGAAVHNLLGVALAAQGRFVEAAAAFEEAARASTLSGQPDQPPPLRAPLSR